MQKVTLKSTRIPKQQLTLTHNLPLNEDVVQVKEHISSKFVQAIFKVIWRNRVNKLIKNMKFAACSLEHFESTTEKTSSIEIPENNTKGFAKLENILDNVKETYPTDINLEPKAKVNKVTVKKDYTDIGSLNYKDLEKGESAPIFNYERTTMKFQHSPENVSYKEEEVSSTPEERIENKDPTKPIKYSFTPIPTLNPNFNFNFKVNNLYIPSSMHYFEVMEDPPELIDFFGPPKFQKIKPSQHGKLNSIMERSIQNSLNFCGSIYCIEKKKVNSKS
ncbi:hypothetical protein HDU92_004463 [Lobulomyces angularis]|nr:hypothetical protein HDU92_004463 [Lobulomyces angularis]